ncbi:hypothetical protein Tco_0358999 [Tanacetum coccineum]
MRPFRCPVTILNTIDHLGKFDGKADEGFFVGYSTNSKTFRVFNSITRIVEEYTVMLQLFDIDALTNSMNYKPVVAGNQSNGNAGTKACNDADLKSSPDVGFKPLWEEEKKDAKDPWNESGNPTKGKDKVNVVDPKTSIKLPNDPIMPELEDIVYSDDDEDVGAEADMNNLDAFMPVSPIPTTRIQKDHQLNQIIGDFNSVPQTRKMIKNLKEHEEPKKVIHALKDPSWIEAMQDELLQFKLQKMDVKSAFCKQKEDGIFISQDKYVTKILKKISFTDVKTVSTPMETHKPLLKDADVCACARYQVNPKVSHLHAMKRSFKYLKGQPKLGLCYPKDSPFDLVAYTDSDYAGASLDRKSTTGGCQFLGARQFCLMAMQEADCNAVRRINLQLLVRSYMLVEDEVANEEHVPTQSNDPPLSRVNTLGSREDRLSLNELMNLCTKLSDKVLDLETTKIAQAKEIADKVETDYELAQRLQAEEQEELTIEEKSKLFQQLLEKRGSTLQLREQKKGEVNHLPKLNKEYMTTLPEKHDLIWRNLQGKKVLLWRLYDSCGVHFVRFEDMNVYMLVDMRYPLTSATITDMLNKKLKSDYWN